MALLDASAPMQAMAVGVKCCYIENHLVLDPVEAEEAEASAAISLIFSNTKKPFPLAASMTTGRISEEALAQCMAAGREATKKMLEFFKVAVRRKIQAATQHIEEENSNQEEAIE